MTVKQRIEAFNAGRDPQRLRLKYDLMRADAFSFLRATCHLFYEDIHYAALPEAPAVWCCGDLHLQNFGAYKGDNRLTYFDINDFDEACLAPVTFDLLRFLTSVIVAAGSIRLPPASVDELLQSFLRGYTSGLRKGKPLFLERETSTGLIHDLLAKLKKRDRRKFLRSRTTGHGLNRRLLLDDKRALPLHAGEFEMLTAFAADFAKRQARPDFFELLDAARRIAGASSLGLPRYVLLVKGRGGDDGNFLLDLKFQPPSCVTRAHPLPQPAFPSDAHRVAFAETAVQAVEPALFTPVPMDTRWWLLRELMPTSDRLDLAHAHTNRDEFRDLLATLGNVVAWGNLRAGGRRGAASPDDLITFGHDETWFRPLIAAARVCAQTTEQNILEFRMKA